MFNWIKSKNTLPTDQTSPLSAKDKLISEAMSNAKTAREAIGQETLDKVRAAMERQQQAASQKQRADAAIAEVSPMEQAKKILLSMEPGKLSDHLRLLRDQNKLH